MHDRRMKQCLLAVCVWIAGSLPAAFADDVEQVKENYRKFLTASPTPGDSLWSGLMRIEPETEMSDQMVVELHQRYPVSQETVEALLDGMNDDGSWRDIDYADTRRSGWDPKRHAERILLLAKLYYKERSPYRHSEQLRERIHRGLAYWFTAKPVSLNWWNNQIGVPKTLGAAFILLEKELSPQEMAEAVKVMENAHFGMTGQNKVWLAGNVLIRGLLLHDEPLVRAARDTIASEITIGDKEGIRPDWSFHQHGPQQQFGNYGLSYISGMSFFSRLFNGTAYAFGERENGILTSLVERGYKWVIWNRHMDISSLGRQLFHNAPLHKGYALAFAAADLGIGGFPDHGNLLCGHKHFGCSDFTVHRTPSWMATLKMSSRRVIGTEQVNEDNLLGYYMGDGATYFYVRGDEYLNVFPLWDWRKIPGVTAYEDNAPLPRAKGRTAGNRTERVGGLTAGDEGLSVMELNRNGLHARKAWLFTSRYVLCLGTAIRSDSALCVTTAVDQRLRRDGLRLWDGTAWHTVEGQETLRGDTLRLHHDRTGYIIIGKENCIAESGRRTGRWCDFMKMYRPATVEGEVVSLHLSHGSRPQGAAYCYLVLPDTEPEETARFHGDSLRIVRNEEGLQIISPAEGCYWIAAYERGDFEVDGYPFRAEREGVYYAERKGDRIVVKGESPFLHAPE